MGGTGGLKDVKGAKESVQQINSKTPCKHSASNN